MLKGIGVCGTPASSSPFQEDPTGKQRAYLITRAYETAPLGSPFDLVRICGQKVGLWGVKKGFQEKLDVAPRRRLGV